MRHILVGTFLALTLAGMAASANADHCKKWSDCFFEDLQRRGG